MLHLNAVTFSWEQLVGALPIDEYWDSGSCFQQLPLLDYSSIGTTSCNSCWIVHTGVISSTSWTMAECPAWVPH